MNVIFTYRKRSLSKSTSHSLTRSSVTIVMIVMKAAPQAANSRFSTEPAGGCLKQFATQNMRQIRRTPDEKVFNALIREHLYLGYTQLVGEHLKYLAYAGDRAISCLAFSSAPYTIYCRDKNQPLTVLQSNTVMPKSPTTTPIGIPLNW